MLKNIIIPIALLALVLPVVSCNKESEDEMSYLESSSVLVSGFSLKADKNVLDSLQNVFFSIDLENALIFNADSLPYGTNVRRIVPTINAPSSAREVKLRFYDDVDNRDSVVDYLKNSTDSINFANGPVTLSILSENGAVRRDYKISINVHKVKSDSLAWYKMENMPLPTSLKRPTAQGFALLNDVYYCITSDGTSMALAYTTTPDNPQWKISDYTLPFTPDIESLRYSSDAVYMLDTDGNLMTSRDMNSWVSTGERWQYIIGGYNSEILGTAKIDNEYMICSYPSGSKTQAPIGFPVENTSIPAAYDLPMGYGTQLVVLGGKSADGNVNGDAWGYDGSSWIKLSRKPLPVALQNITLVPYHLMEYPSSTWVPQSYPVLVAMGGRTGEGSVNRTVYYSRDWGVTWNLAPRTMQLPEEVPAFYNAVAFNYTTVMHVSSRAAGWSEIPVRPLPTGACFIYNTNPASRAIAPITQWDCPAIYLMGGKSPEGMTYTDVWRGVILQFTFKPVQ